MSAGKIVKINDEYKVENGGMDVFEVASNIVNNI